MTELYTVGHGVAAQQRRREAFGCRIVSFACKYYLKYRCDVAYYMCYFVFG